MRRVIYEGPTVNCLATRPTGRGGVSLASGAEIDLDEVIGAPGVTIAEALGPLAAHCRPVGAMPAAYEGLPADEDEE